MATDRDRRRRSVAVEVTVASEAEQWLLRQVMLTSRPEDDQPDVQQRKPKRASRRRTREAVVVPVGFKSLEECSADDGGGKGRRRRPPSGLHTIVSLLILFALTLLAGAHVIELPETLKMELGMGLAALSVFAGLHALTDRQ